MCPAAAFPPGTQGWPRADTGWASPVPVLWTAAVGAARPSTAPAELRPNEGPARPGLPRDRPPPILGVSRHGAFSHPSKTGPGASPRHEKPPRVEVTEQLRRLREHSPRARRGVRGRSRTQPSPPGRGRPARLH